MKSITTHKGILSIVERMPNSTYGNPRYLVQVMDFSAKEGRLTGLGYAARTIPNSSEGYSIPNYEGKLVECEIGVHRNNVHIQNVRLARR